MEDNNKIDNDELGNNTNGFQYGSSLYGTQPEPDAEETNQLSVYGQGEMQPVEQSVVQESQPEQMTVQPEQPKQETNQELEQTIQQSETGQKMTTMSESDGEETPQVTTPVSLEKPAHTEQQPRVGQTYQSVESQPANGNPQGFYGQPVNPSQMNVNQMNGYQPNYNGQPMNPNQMNGYQPNYNGQPMNPNQMNGYQPNYNGQPMNPNQMSGYQPNYNGQPMNSNQMNYNGQPMNYAQPKKSKAGLIIGITAAVAVAAIVVVCILFSKLFSGNPKKQLAKGMANMTKEMAAYSSSISEDLGIDELGKLRKIQPMHTNIDLSFTNPNATGDFDNASVEIDAISDVKNKQGKYDVSIGTYGFDMEIGSIVADSNILYFSSPLVLKDDVYSLNLTNLGKDFNNSAWADLLNTTLPEDSSFTLFDDSYGNSETDVKNSLELAQIIEKYTKDMTGSISYASIKEKREFPYGGAMAAYGGVQVTVDKDAYNNAIENMKNDIFSSTFYADYLDKYKTTRGADFDAYKKELDNIIEQLFGIRFEQDVVFNFYLDKKGRIINISTPEDITVSSPYAEVDSIAVDIDFGGSERTLDSIEGGIYMQSGDEILYLGISRIANVTDDYYSEDLTIRLQSDSSEDDISVYYGNDWGYSDKTYDMAISIQAAGESVSLTAKGGYENIVKGEGYTFRVNNAALTVDDEELLIMSGVISMEPEDSKKIDVPQNATDILQMTEEDITAALYKAIYSLQ